MDSSTLLQRATPRSFKLVEERAWQAQGVQFLEVDVVSLVNLHFLLKSFT